MVRLLGVGIMAVSGLVFYIIFFKLTPVLAGLIPMTEWTPLLKVLTFVFVGWFGGVGIPIALLVLGITLVIID